MSDDFQRPGSRRSSRDIPRRGYERQRDATGTLRPPSLPQEEDYQAEARSPLRPPPSPPPPRRGSERAPRDSGLYLPWWSLLILVFFVGGASFGLLYFVANLSGAVLAEPTPRVIIVTSALDPTTASRLPQESPTPLPTNPPTPQNFLPTAESSLTPIPGGCLLGNEVLIFGTQGVGLNLRDKPGGEVQFIAKEGERMLVIDGPVFFDNFQWCQVRSVAQNSSFGWAAQNFLLPADSLEATEE